MFWDKPFKLKDHRETEPATKALGAVSLILFAIGAEVCNPLVKPI